MDTVKDYKGQEHQVDVQGLVMNDVMFVYSGRKGACACGCKGKYSYHQMRRAESSKWRGYRVTDDELNERQVNRVLGHIKRNVSTAKYDENVRYLSVDVGTRTYVVYLSKAFKG